MSDAREFYVEVSPKDGKWFLVVGEEGKPDWLWAEDGVSSSMIAEKTADAFVEGYVRQHRIKNYWVNKRVFRGSSKGHPYRTAAANPVAALKQRLMALGR